MIIQLIQNAALLISLSILFGLLYHLKERKELLGKLLMALLFSGIAIAGMKMPVVYDEGVIYDGRSVVMTMAGFFGGSFITIIAAIISSLYRIYIGGIGVYAGVLTIITTGLGGLVFRWYLKGKVDEIKISQLYILGIISPSLMLISQLLLPWPEAFEILKTIWLPVMIVFPVATTLMGLLLRNEIKRAIGVKKIIESESLYRTTLQSIGDAVITTDINGMVKFINPVAQFLTDFSKEEAIGKSIDVVFNLIVEDNSDELLNVCNVRSMITKGEESVSNPFAKINSKSNNQLSISYKCSLLRDGDNKVNGSVLTFRDRSSENKLLNKLKDSQERFQWAVENIPDVVILYDRNLKVQYVNSAIQLLTGKHPAEMIGLSDQDIFEFGVYGKYIHILKKTLSDGRSNTINVDVEFEKGIKRNVYITAIPLKEKSDRVRELMCIITDLTQFKKAEVDLSQSKRLFQTLVENAPIGIFRTDRNGNTIFVNSKWCEITGMSVAEAFKSNWYKKIHKHDRKVWVDAWRKLRDNPVNLTTEFRITSEKFGVKNLLGEIIPEVSNNGEITSFIGVIIDITQRIETEKALKSSEESLNAAQILGQMGGWEFNLDTGISIWTENAYRILGYEPHEVEASFENYVERIVEEDKGLVQGNFQDRYGHGKQVDTEVRIILPSGELRWIQSRVIPIVKKKKVISLKGVLIDITDYKEATEALRVSEEGYRNLFQNHSAAKVLIDPKTGTIEDANIAALNYYGMTLGEIKGMLVDNFNIRSVDNHEFSLIEFLKAGNNHAQIIHSMKNGSARAVEVFSSRILFKNKEYIHAIIHDITDKVEGEKQLKLLNKAIEQTPVSMVIANIEGDIEYVNKQFTKVTGYEFDEVVGKNPRILKSEAHSAKFYKKLWDTILSGNVWTGELLNKRKDGDLFWEQAIITPMLDNNNEITHFIAAKEDITEKKRMIEDIIIAKEQAEEAERLKSAFLANMSHEIRTPLNVILGFTQMLTNDDELDEDQKTQFVSIINKSSEGLLQIINDILDISKLETGQLEISKHQFKLEDTLNEVFTAFKQKIKEEEKDLQLNLLINPNIQYLTTDENRFVQILNNLLSNSLKFTEQGSITFGVNNLTEEFIEFVVSDTGIGIKEDLLPSIFDRFRQADSSLARTYGGTGLGLSIVKNLVELMGGEIKISSTIGKGTTTIFTIPK